MRRLTGIVFLLGAAATVLFLFHIKHEVRTFEADLEATQRRIVEHQEAIQVLRTEWSYLNQPARIAELARRHLGLGPISAARIVSLDELPERRLPAVADKAGGPRVRPTSAQASQ